MKDISAAHFGFSRRIKLQYFFHKKTYNRKPNKFPISSNWLPPAGAIDDQILNILKNLKSKLSKLPRRNKMTPTAKLEHKILHKLKQHCDIIFKPADKGQSIVIQNRSDYIQEANRQLSIPLHYKKLESPVGHIHHNKINTILNQLKSRRFINSKELKYCLIPNTDNRQRLMYFTPKIHKPRKSWFKPNIPKARPIISDCGSDRYNLSRLLDYYLTPISNKHPSYLKDTPDFISKITTVKPPSQFFFFSLDVESLYTNICPEAAISAVRSLMTKHPDPNRPDAQVLELLEICLRNNEFEFDSQLYLQLFGFAMGFRSAPKLADIYASKLEQSVLSRTQNPPHTWYRFLDDIFGLYQHSMADFQQLLEQLNSYHQAIKFTATIDQNQIVFLDTMVSKGHNYQAKNILDVKVNFKTTDTHSLLHFDSYHPPACFKGILKSQILRFRRICNNITDTHAAIDTLFSVLHTRGYPQNLTSNIRHTTLANFLPKFDGSVTPCNTRTCKLHNLYLSLDNKILSPNNTLIPTIGHFTCDTTNIIYAVTCTICNLTYVGQTSNSARTRLHTHTSNIRCHRSTILSDHVNDCIRYSRYTLDKIPIKVTLLERIEIHTDSDTNRINLLQTESDWMEKLQSIKPTGINSKKDLITPIPFILTYHDHSPQFAATIRQAFTKIQKLHPKIFRNRLVFAHKRNKNIKDYLVRAKLGTLP